MFRCFDVAFWLVGEYIKRNYRMAFPGLGCICGNHQMGNSCFFFFSFLSLYVVSMEWDG